MELVLRDSVAPVLLAGVRPARRLRHVHTARSSRPTTPRGGSDRRAEFAGYHTSADVVERIRPESLAEAVDRSLELVEVLETNRRFTNLSPYGEPQL
jgi:hypothetical protein